MANLHRQIRKRMQSTNDLKAALIELILESNSPDSITVSEIAGRADYNRSTFYFHYKDKNELLEELFREAIDGFRSAVETSFLHVRSINIDEVAPMTRLSFGHVERNKNLFKALHLIRMNDSLYERLEEMYLDLFHSQYRFDRQNPDPHIDDEMTANYQIHAMIGTVKYWIQSDFKYSADYMCEQITRVHANRPTDIVAQS